MHGAFTTIGRNLAGPFGIAAGLYAVGKALENFNLKTLELSHISANVHISIEDLTKLRQAAWRTTGDIKSGLAQVQRVVEVVDTLRFSRSQFYDDLRIMGRKSLADSLRNAVLAGQGMDAVRQLYDDFAKEDDSHQHALTVAVGVDRVILAQGF